MATFKEIAERYAKDIRRAVRQTKLEKPISEGLIKKAFLIEDPLLETLKSIQRDLDRYTYKATDKPLSEDTKREILTTTGKILGLSRPDNIVYIVKEASNENALELIDYIGQFIDEVTEKEEEE